MQTLSIQSFAGGVRFSVHVQPRASRTEVVGIHGDAIKIRVAAPPVEGAANEELVGFLAKQLGVARAAVRIARGETGRQKVIEVAGVEAVDVRRLVGADIP